MDHPLHRQQRQQQQPQHYQPQAQAMAMQGTHQVGSPSAHANYITQQGPQHPMHPQTQHMTASQYQYAQYQQQTQQPMMPQQHLPQHQMQQQYALQQHHSMPYPANSHSRSFTAGNSVMSPPPVMGPRAKCDQVIHEAVAKACEIAVRGRCTDCADGSVGVGNEGGRGHSDGMIGKRRSLNYGGGNQTNSGSTSSRFNIEVDEVPLVRSTVAGWKGAPHVPLRLDIYYEHDACFDENEATPNQPPPPPQRELLERWCVDYVPSSSLSGNSSLNNSLSSSPSTTSPYSSRMTGVHVSEKPVPTSHMSQLRQVCKRIVVLLRSLHCLARMLPSYRLRSLLLSNMAAGGGGVTVNNNGTITEMAAGGNGVGVGWGTIGFSVHAGEPEAWDPALPSPSFARQSLPSIPTPYGKLCLSVMYDATLNPDLMVAELTERRSEWMQRKWMGMGGVEAQYVDYQQPLQYIGGEQEYPVEAAPISTPPIPIAQMKQHVSISPGQPTVSSLPGAIHVRREYGSCPPAALGSPNSPAVAGRSRAVSDFIIKDYHNSPRLGPTRAPLESPGNVGGIDNKQTGGLGGAKQRVMSGLSLAMMNEEDNTTPVEAPPDDQVNYRKRSSSLGSHQQYQEEKILIPFGSPVTRAAFHNPPPMYQDDGNQAGSLGTPGGGNQQGTHFFQRHGGYGYGYNGANMQVPAPPVSTPPSDETIHTGRKSLAGSKSPLVMQGAPPSIQSPASPGARTSMHASRHAPGSPQRGSAAVADGKGGSEAWKSYRRTSSSSSALLPPVTSLDVLQKSPFQSMRKTSAEREGEENRGNDILRDYREDTLSSAIPWMVERGSGSIGVSTLGGGSSGLPMMPPMSSGLSSAKGSALRGSQREAQELPFAVDDDGQPTIGASSSRSPTKSTSRSLWGSTKADVLSGTLGATGGGGGGVAEITSALAVSSLHHRCATDGKIRLKMFDDAKRAEGDVAVGTGGGGGSLDEQKADSAANKDGAGDRQSSEYASFRDQLSDFRSFGESLMADSTANSKTAG